MYAGVKLQIFILKQATYIFQSANHNYIIHTSQISVDFTSPPALQKAACVLMASSAAGAFHAVNFIFRSLKI